MVFFFEKLINRILLIWCITLDTLRASSIKSNEESTSDPFRDFYVTRLEERGDRYLLLMGNQTLEVF